MQSVDKLKLIAKCLDDKKGKKIVALEVGQLTSISDYFVIASGGSQTQVKALADNVTDKLAEQGIMPVHIEGYGGGSWILLDYSDIVVHIFTDEMREFYDIERLWTDAKEITLDFLDDA
ncbi:MAG: ribosome silencing factor [Ruminococcaceae bacterium]|nr:ribosome silencing factor [Oscillospiraceae bacterium]